MDYKIILDNAPARKTYGQYTKLIADGSFWRGRCPLCKSEDNTFLVIKQNKEFYCYECHRHGNMVLFTAEVESITLTNAAQFLVNRWGIQLDDKYNAKPIESDLN